MVHLLSVGMGAWREAMSILAAYKPTAEGRAALENAAAEARLRGTRLVVARHVKLSSEFATAGPPDANPDVDGGQMPREAGTDREVSKLREEMESFAQRFRSEGLECDAWLLTRDGDTADELMKLAEDERADMIVIGVRRRSPVGKAFLGSESQDILLQADCPVLAVKAP